jgi:hypothetical protein
MKVNEKIIVLWCGVCILFCLITQGCYAAPIRASSFVKQPVAMRQPVQNPAISQVRLSNSSATQSTPAARVNSGVKTANDIFKENLKKYGELFANFSTSTGSAQIKEGVSGLLKDVVVQATDNPEISLENKKAAQAFMEKLISTLLTIGNQISLVSSRTDPRLTDITNARVDLQKQNAKLASILHSSVTTTSSLAPAARSTSSAATGGAVAVEDPVFKRRLAEIAAMPKVYERILATKGMLTLVTAATLSANKNKLVSACNNLWLSIATMKRPELEVLRELFKEAQINSFFLSLAQRAVIEQWEKSLDFMIEISDAQSDLFTTVANKINNVNDYAQSLKACLCGLDLLSTKLQPQQKNMLMALFKTKVNALYNGRAKRSIVELMLLHDMLVRVAKVSEKQPLLKGVLGKNWIEPIKLNISIFEVQSERDANNKLKALEKIAGLLKNATRYEKNIFMSELATFFANRKDRAETELEGFNLLLTKLTANEFKNQRILQTSDFSKMEGWKNILNITLTLLRATIIKDKKQVMVMVTGLFEPAVGVDKKQTSSFSLALWKQLDYEKGLLVSLFTPLFNDRGDLGKDALLERKKFFEIIKKASSQFSLLTTSQITALDSWLQELAFAVVITTATGTYIDSFFARALASKNIDEFVRVIMLMTEKTSYETKNKLFDGLKFLNTNRRSFDPNKLQTLFVSAYEKKTEKDFVLNPNQRVELFEWIETLKKEAPVMGKA